uniref:GRAM domain-containing protein n=1 Tax=Spongospora subterranea TaxID=70186 RepID=A0A0H5RP72_9EUKA|eukprot:CRZ10529.1 hypothetical protein [Spongospora subterranea]
MSINDQFVVRNLDTGEVFRPRIEPVESSSACPPPSAIDVQEFKRLFNTFKLDEQLLHAVKCKLWESLASFQAQKAKKRHSGVIYISNNHLSFAEDAATTSSKPVRIGIPLTEIVGLTSEDFGLVEGIVVSTMRETKFFFEQFVSRNDCFGAIYRTWNGAQKSPADQLASIFDPLGGFSAVTSNSMLRNAAMSQMENQAASVAADMLNSSNISSTPKSSKLPPPIKTHSNHSASIIRPAPPPPTFSTSPVLSHSPNPPRPAVIVPGAQTQRQTKKIDGPPERHYMDLSSGDSWFMTLTKIYYWLGAPARQRNVRSPPARTPT